MEDSTSAVSFILSEFPEGIPTLPDDNAMPVDLDLEVERTLGNAALQLQPLEQPGGNKTGMQLEESPIYGVAVTEVVESPAPRAAPRPAALQQPGAPLLAFVPRLNEEGLAKEQEQAPTQQQGRLSSTPSLHAGAPLSRGAASPLEQLLPAPGCATAGRLRHALSAVAVTYRQLELCFDHARQEVALARAAAAAEQTRAVDAAAEAAEARQELRFCRLTLAAHLPRPHGSNDRGINGSSTSGVTASHALQADEGEAAEAEAAASAAVAAATGPALAAAATQISALSTTLGARDRDIATLRAHLRDLLAVASFPASVRPDVDAAAALAMPGVVESEGDTGAGAAPALIRDVALAALRAEVDRLNAEVVAAAVAAAARGREADAKVAAADARVAAAEDSRRREATRCAEAEAVAEGLRARLAAAQAEAERARQGWVSAQGRLAQAEEAVGVLIAEVRARDRALADASAALSAAGATAAVLGGSGTRQEDGPPAPQPAQRESSSSSSSSSGGSSSGGDASSSQALLAAMLHGGAPPSTLMVAATYSEEHAQEEEEEDEEDDTGSVGYIGGVLAAQRAEVQALRAQVASLEAQLAAAAAPVAAGTAPSTPARGVATAAVAGGAASAPATPPPVPPASFVTSPWLADMPPLPPPSPELGRAAGVAEGWVSLPDGGAPLAAAPPVAASAPASLPHTPITPRRRAAKRQ